jgi:hypothetical protein
MVLAQRSSVQWAWKPPWLRDPVVARLEAAVAVVDGNKLGCIGEDTMPDSAWNTCCVYWAAHGLII